MSSKRKNQKELVATAVANIADVAGPRTVDQKTYFAVIADGIEDWLRDEERVRSTPQGSADGLSDPQRRVLEVGLRRIAQAARTGRRVCVVASTASVQRVMEQQAMNKTATRYIFHGWKKRMEKRRWQPVVIPLGDYLMVLSIEGTAGRREIRALVAAGRQVDEAWRLSLVLDPDPPVVEEMESIAAPELPAGTDPLVAAVATSTYLVWRKENKELAAQFYEFCEKRHVEISLWLRRELRRKHVRVVESVQVVEVTHGVVTGGTEGALALQSGGGAIKKRTPVEEQKSRTILSVNPAVADEIARRLMEAELRGDMPHLDPIQGLDEREIAGVVSNQSPEITAKFGENGLAADVVKKADGQD